MKKSDIEKSFTEIEEIVNKFLLPLGIKMPKINTKNFIVLSYLYNKINQEVSKEELTMFLKEEYGEDTNDVQQARHLGKQKGFFILSGTRGDVHPESKIKIKKDHYLLFTLEKPYPGFSKKRRNENIKDWESVKQLYNNCCATCGAKEGKPHYKYETTNVFLEKGHCDPNLPLENSNIIPQCRECNKIYKDKFIFSQDGNISKINIKSKQVLSLIKKEDLKELLELIQKGI